MKKIIVIIAIILGVVFFLLYNADLNNHYVKSNIFFNNWQSYIYADTDQNFLIQVPWYFLNNKLNYNILRIKFENFPEAEIVNYSIEKRYEKEGITQYLICIYSKVKNTGYYKINDLKIKIVMDGKEKLVNIGNWVFDTLPFDFYHLKVRECICKQIGINKLENPEYTISLENISNETICIKDLYYEIPSLIKKQIYYDEGIEIDKNEWKEIPEDGLTIFPYDGKILKLSLNSTEKSSGFHILKPKLRYIIDEKEYEMPLDMLLIGISPNKQELLRMLREGGKTLP